MKVWSEQLTAGLKTIHFTEGNPDGSPNKNMENKMNNFERGQSNPTEHTGAKDLILLQPKGTLYTPEVTREGI